MRYKLLMIFLVLLLPVWASVAMSSDTAFWQKMDTLRISEVQVVKSRLSHYNGTEKNETIAAIQLKVYESADLSYLLGKTALVNVVNYGSAGRQSTINIRGGSSNHTAVLWNGIPVNSLTTGGADLSMLNVGAFEQVNVVYGASGSLYGSGTFGGAVLLNNEHTFNEEKQLNLNVERASFSNNRIRIGGKLSNKTVSYTGQVFYADGKNDFTYRDTHEVGHPIDTISNAENTDFATIHNIGLKLNEHHLSLGVWYQIKDLNIGGKMGFGPPVSNQSQKDSTLKVFAGWKYLLNSFRFEFQSAWSSDFLRYTDREPIDNTWKIYSEIDSKRWLNTFSVRYYCSNNFNIDVQTKYNKLRGITNNYRKDREEEEGNIALAGQYQNGQLTVNASFSKEWNTVTSPPVVYNAGVLYEVISNVLYANAKYSTYYRRPTFNERYWVPGGNPDINAEQGFGYEGGIKAVFDVSDQSALMYDFTVYQAINEEMIIWVPDEDTGLATPENANSVKATGIESSVHWKWKSDKASIDFSGRYAFNKTIYNDPDEDNYKRDLIYKPNNIVRANWVYSRTQWHGGVNVSYQTNMLSVEGERMDEVFLSDLFASYQVTLPNNVDVTLQFKVNNVLNTNYQLVYGFPMPRRNYSLGINISI